MLVYFFYLIYAIRLLIKGLLISAVCSAAVVGLILLAKYLLSFV